MPLPSPSEPAIQTAARLLAQGRPDEAARQLAGLVAEAPTYAAAHVLHATALEAVGRPDDALDAWARAAVLVPRSPLVHRERGRLLAARRGAPTGDAPAPTAEALAAPLALPDDTSSDAAAPDVATLGASGPVPPEPEAPAPLADEDRPSSAPLDVADLLYGDAPMRAPSTPNLDAEPDEEPDDGWTVLVESADDEGSGDDARSVADELDALISQLEDAPRIRPDPAFNGPAVALDAGGGDEVASETLAKIYAAQGQYAEAAAVYDTLAARQPGRAAELRTRAAEMRERAS